MRNGSIYDWEFNKIFSCITICLVDTNYNFASFTGTETDFSFFNSFGVSWKFPRRSFPRRLSPEPGRRSRRPRSEPPADAGDADGDSCGTGVVSVVSVVDINIQIKIEDQLLGQHQQELGFDQHKQILLGQILLK
jgi:hypothetical protein